MAAVERSAARLALASLPGAPREPLHLLPCSIQHDGPAAVARYFAPAVRRDPEAPDGEASVSFRGRSLKGKESCLPKGYVGLVLEEANLGLTLKEREVSVKSTFDSLTVWNLEQAPTNSDEIFMALAWPKIAQGLHAPVTEEE
ncbi:ribonuclease H2 subunit C-like [Protobothrops mucrosquamatus]|uniref:ribonuclease H2 subunit C n=1 Tax=Protobothrops mucrosquamatus TaxID=103944 RepID=UPI000775BB25|nr:ribonuclease H2 subunit C [Protobothrops mucrosquamatus]XP_015686280.1 ribonuclease H2 subunit C-like [Protobothrops mucrosquamatus]